MQPSSPSDLTPVSGSPTDVTPVGRDQPTPPHELTAANDGDPVNWEAAAASAEFRALLRAKARFIIPATIFFVVYYFTLPILVGYYPKLTETKVWGDANFAYVFAFSQFIMAWILAAIYVRVAAGWDRRAAKVIQQFASPRR